MEILEIDVKYFEINKLLANITLNGNFSSNIRNETKMGNLTAFIQYSAQSLSFSNKTRERHRRYTNKKERCQTMPIFRICSFTLKRTQRIQKILRSNK